MLETQACRKCSDDKYRTSNSTLLPIGRFGARPPFSANQSCSSLDELMKHLSLTCQTINLYAAQIIRNALVEAILLVFKMCWGGGYSKIPNLLGPGTSELKSTRQWGQKSITVRPLTPHHPHPSYLFNCNNPYKLLKAFPPKVLLRIHQPNALF